MLASLRQPAVVALTVGTLVVGLILILPRARRADAVSAGNPWQAVAAAKSVRTDPRWSLNRQLQVLLWPTSVEVSGQKIGSVHLFVAVLNTQDRPVGVHSALRLGIGMQAEGRRQGGPALTSAIPRYRVVLKRKDFLWLPSGHFYGVRVSPSEVFPELAKPGDYVLSFQYANPFRVDMGKGRLPFLGHTEPAVVQIKISRR